MSSKQVMTAMRREGDDVFINRDDVDLMRDTLFQIMAHGCARWPLSRVVNLVRGQPISQDTAEPGNIPVIGGGAKSAYYTNKANHEGPIITISHQGTAGYVGWWDEPIFLAPQCFGLEVNDLIMYPRYLYQYLKNQEHRIMAMRYGNTVPAVNWETVGNLEVLIPHPEKQRKILDGLESFESITNDRIGELVQRLEEVRKQREYVTEAIFEAFGGGGR